MIKATFEVEPAGSAAALAEVVSSGMAGGPDRARGQVVEEGGSRAVIGFPADNLAGTGGMLDPGLLLAAVLGEGMEMGSLTRCRLVALEVPAGLLPGPAVGASETAEVGVIVKPSVGLGPGEVAAVVGRAVAAGVRFVKDDEMHAAPPWCPLEQRVAAVAPVLADGVVYCANVNGPAATLVERARRAVELGATGLLVSPFLQGLSGLLALRQAGLGVPLFAHRAGSGAWTRGDRFGATGAVLALLTRLCGADYVIAGAFGGKLFDSDEQVAANVASARTALKDILPATATLGGGLGPDDVAAQVGAAGGQGVLALLGSAAYSHPGGVGDAVTQARGALGLG